MSESQTTRELLESTHDFPCQYVIKAIGKTENDFQFRVVSAVREALAWDFDPPCETRETAGGKHISVTFDLRMQNADEVLKTYSELMKTEGLVVLL
jgi:putative lipoic acid-binding regulatory protein